MIENINEYARFFDSHSIHWCGYGNTLERNLMFLRCQERYLNCKLQIEGKLYLNQVYEMLDLKITDPDSQLGWKYDPDKGEHQVDLGVVDPYDWYGFGCYDYEDYILLNFNNVCLID